MIEIVVGVESEFMKYGGVYMANAAISTRGTITN